MFGPLRVRGANKEEAEKLGVSCWRKSVWQSVHITTLPNFWWSTAACGDCPRAGGEAEKMLFDEPTSALDPELRHEVLRLCRIWLKKG